MLFPWEKPRVGLPYFDQWTTQAPRGPLSYCRVKVRTWISSSQPRPTCTYERASCKRGVGLRGQSSTPALSCTSPGLSFTVVWEPRSPLSQDACVLLAVPKISCKQIPSAPNPSQPSLLSSDPPWCLHFLPLLSLQCPNTPPQTPPPARGQGRKHLKDTPS